MKKLTYLLFIAIGVMGCSADALNEDLLVADAKFKVTVAESFNVPDGICAGVPAQFSFAAAVGTNLQVQQFINEDWVQVYQTSQSTSNPQTFELSFAEAGSYSLRYKIGNGGFTNASPVMVSNCNDCEESFSYIANEDGSYTFNYVPAEDMNGVNVVFTFAQGSYVSGLDEAFSQNGNNGQTYETTMNLKKCDVLSYTVSLSAKCSGNSKSSNVWTDFKVNDDSKKHDGTPNIEKSC